MIVSFDMETSSKAPLNSVGAYRYIEDVSTRALMFAWHPVGQPEKPQLWCEGDPIPEDFAWHVRQGSLFSGWNVLGFDRIGYKTLLVDRFDFPAIPDDNWIDSMHRAASTNLPRSLDGAARAVGVQFDENKKDKARIQRITNPDKTPIPFLVSDILSGRAPEAATLRTAPGLTLLDDMQWLAARCVQDVTMEEDVLAALAEWPQVRPWQFMPSIDRKINDHGVLLDMKLVEGLAKAAKIEMSRLDGDMNKLTKEKVKATTNVEALKVWLVERGVELPTAVVPDEEDDAEDEEETYKVLSKKSPWRLRKSDIADLIARDDVPEECRLALMMRAEAAKASVRKLRTMLACCSPDGRLRGALVLGGAQATMRWSSGKSQLHNLVRDKFASYDDVATQMGLDPKRDRDRIRQTMPQMLRTAIEVGRTGDPDLMRVLYETPRTDMQKRVTLQGVLPWISRMMRRTISAPEGSMLINGDFANIEARIPVWLAGQEETVQQFARGEDLYRIAAAPVYGLDPAELSVEQRQIGKCIAEGSLVLTDRGLVPIEKVPLDSKVWDGIAWVSHEGPVFQGWKETIVYDGLEATPDHRVWVWKEGQPAQMEFQQAAAGNYDLVRSGLGGRPVWLGDDSVFRETQVEQGQLVCSDEMQRLQQRAVDSSSKPTSRKVEGVSGMLATCTNSCISETEFERRKTKVREPQRQKISQLRRPRNSVLLQLGARSGPVGAEEYRPTSNGDADRSRREQQTLRTGQFAMGDITPARAEYPIVNAVDVQGARHTKRTRATRNSVSSTSDGLCGSNTAAVRSRSENSGSGIEPHRRSASIVQTKRPVWDILNAGPRHRFTVSGKLVHNCMRLFLGFMGGVNAFVPAAMNYGITISRDDGQIFVTTFRETNKPLVEYADRNLEAARMAIWYPGHEFFVEPKGLVSWIVQDNCLKSRLPSGRYLRYWQPRLEQGKWPDGRLKRDLDVTVLVIKGRAVFRRTLWRGLALENQVQAIAADMLGIALENMDRNNIPVVLHVHDSAAAEVTVDRAEMLRPVFEQCMLDQPSWSYGLPIAVDASIDARFG